MNAAARPSYPTTNGQRLRTVHVISREYSKLLTKRLICTTNDLNRYALALTLYDNYLMGRLDNTYFSEVYRTLEKEQNPLVISTLCNHLTKVAFDQPKNERTTMELFFMDLLKNTTQPATRQHLLRALTATAQSQMVNDFLFDIWETSNDPLLSERDYINMAYHLAIMRPANGATSSTASACG